MNPDLVVRDEDGKVNTVRYEAVSAMLLNEFLKEHQKLTEFEATVSQQQKEFRSTIERQQKQIEALTATLQKVADRLDADRSIAPRTVANVQ